MQKAQELSQPVWIVIHAAQGTSRTAVRAGAWSAAAAGSGASSTSTIGALGRGAAQQLRCGRQVVGPEDDVDVPRALDDALAVHLGEAAPDGDLEPGSARAERLQLAEVAVELVVGVLPDAAGVEDDDVGVLQARRGDEAVGTSRPARRSESCSFIWHP